MDLNREDINGISFSRAYLYILTAWRDRFRKTSSAICAVAAGIVNIRYYLHSSRPSGIIELMSRRHDLYETYRHGNDTMVPNEARAIDMTMSALQYIVRRKGELKSPVMLQGIAQYTYPSPSSARQRRSSMTQKSMSDIK